MANQIVTDELDFDLVKSNIKNYLKGQDVYSDYDFEGSAMSVLIDMLAYNTVYNGFYNHLAINEMFLDSASKYASVVSLSKTIGYTPRSITSARALVNITISSVIENPSVLTMPKGTQFNGTVGTESFSFYTLEDYAAVNESGFFFFENVELVEGLKLSKKYTVGGGTKFILPNPNIDLSTLSVTVQDNISSSGYTKFNRVDDILNVSSTDAVYFIKQREDTQYEIFFGNGTLGKKLNTGNVVTIDYIISNGPAANKARSFVYSSGFRSDIYFQFEVVNVALGGTDAETLESIKFNAPRMYKSQNRAVTIEDYDTLLRAAFPNIESLSIWGGQDNVPAIYGKVFIAAKPTDREFFLEDEKQAFVDYLTTNKNIATITPVIKDPEYIRIQVTTNVYYNEVLSRKTPGDLSTLVRKTILDYSDSLSTFGTSFRFSKLSTLIDKSDPYIISNITTLKLRKVLEPIFNITTKYQVRFENPIYQDRDTGETVWSTRFYIGSEKDRCYFKDDGYGNIDLYLENILGEARYFKTIGTVNYSTGVVEIVDVLIRGLYDREIEVMVTPLSNDIVPIRQYMLAAPAELITVNVIPDVETSSGTKQKHKFSPSR